MKLPNSQPRFFTIIASSDGDVLLATGSGGIMRSDDGGGTWQSLALHLAGLAETIAIGSGTGQGQIMLAGGEGGVLRSADDGISWTTTLAGSPVYALAMAADHADALIALAGTAADGIFRSRDGGRHWLSANAGLFDLEVLALALSPAFAADNTVFAGTVSGLYRSRNGGQAWRVQHAPDGETAVQCLAVSPQFQATGIVLAGTEDAGMLRSIDGGESWNTVSDLDSLGVAAIVWSRASPDLAIASTAHGMARSADAGATWRIVADIGPALSLAAVSLPAGELVVGSLAEGGLIVSSDQGESWREHAVTVG